MVGNFTQPSCQSHFSFFFFSPKTMKWCYHPPYCIRTVQVKSLICFLHWQLMSSDLLISEGIYVPTVYFRIILLSALHGHKPLPGSKALRGLLLLIFRMLPDLTFRNNCSSFQKLEIIKSSLLALAGRDYYPAPTTSCNSQESSRLPTMHHKRYTFPHIRKAIGITQWCV